MSIAHASDQRWSHVQYYIKMKQIHDALCEPRQMTESRTKRFLPHYIRVMLNVIISSYIPWVCLTLWLLCLVRLRHDNVIKWKHLPRYWPFVRGIHRSPVNSHHKGQWHGALVFSLICAWINGWVNNREAGDLRRHHAHYDVIVMKWLR